MNPHLNIEGDLFLQAEQAGALVKVRDPKTGFTATLIQDFGEFECGTVDLSTELGRNWYIENIIHPALDLGIRGWMADFGEYLPISENNLILNSGETGSIAHNKFAEYWSLTNYQAIVKYENLSHEDVFIYYRAGFTESNQYAQYTWAGDQTVDWSRSDGMGSVVPAALSIGMSGMTSTHIDIGLYTTLGKFSYDGYEFLNLRCKELLLRSAEYAVFTPTMRTHESNRPDDNWQVYTDSDTISRYTRLVDLHDQMFGYFQQLSTENLPMQRALCLLFDFIECNNEDYNLQQFMLGDHVLVSPVILPGQTTKTVTLPRLPKGQTWVHLWTGKQFEFDLYPEDETLIDLTVASQVGNPPVFWKNSEDLENNFREIFESFVNQMEEREFQEMCLSDLKPEDETTTQAAVTTPESGSWRSEFSLILSVLVIVHVINI